MVKKVEKAARLLFTDVCDIYEKEVTGDGENVFTKTLKYGKVPCYLSAKAYLFGENAATENNMLTRVIKKAKLFLPPGCVVKEGSEIAVFSNGQTMLYGKSGVMSFYPSHNEVMVETVKDYA